jgi:hypothetical protein
MKTTSIKNNCGNENYIHKKYIVEMKTTSIKNNCGNENYIHKKLLWK